jgi:hypothetical protein
VKTRGGLESVGYSLSNTDSHPLCREKLPPLNGSETYNGLIMNDYSSTSPKVFTENLGQLENSEVRFYDQSGSVWFTDDGVWFELREYAENRAQGSQLRSQEGVRVTPQTHTLPNSQTQTQNYQRVILQQEFVGSNHVTPEGREKLSWCSNFFYGNDTSKWNTNVPNYQEIVYYNIYDGIDLKYYSNRAGFKYDLIVQPGAEVGQIRIRMNGAERLSLEDPTELRFETKFKDVFDRDLKIYQTLDGVKKEIDGNFKIIDNNEYGFEISDDYNKTEILVIDPLLEYSTFIGGGSTEYCNDISVDGSGNAVITGFTYSSTFPTTNGSYNTTKNKKYDCFVTKLSNNGSNLVYSTFIGGADSDYASAIKLDSKGVAYITGQTSSSNFPITENVFNDTLAGDWDVFVLKLNAMGSGLFYSTFIGGSAFDRSWDLDIDASGYVFVTGDTTSIDFPVISDSFDTVKNSSSDCFVLKLNRTGQKLIYSTFLGGELVDIAYGIVVDKLGCAYITGMTDSLDFPMSGNAMDTIRNGTYDGFASKLNKTGKGLVYSTYIGGDDLDAGQAITLKSNNCAVITGNTSSSNFPVTSGANDTDYDGLDDGFVLILNQTGQKTIYSTFIGGDSIDISYDICLDDAENIYITGQTVSSDFPVTSDAYNNILNGYDIFLTKLTPQLSNIIYSTFIGGSLSDKGTAITLDSFNSVYVIGETSSSTFPTTEGSYDTKYAGNWDGIAFKFSFQPTLGIMSVSLLKDDAPQSIVYPKIGPYNIRVNFIHSANVTDLEIVRLILDPWGISVQLNWDYPTDQFSKLNDPNNIFTLEQSSYSTNINNILWTLNFHLTCNWNYPDEQFHAINSYATSSSLPRAWLNITDFYSIEDDLDFFGNLTVVDESNRTIQNNGLVRGNIIMNWTGLIPVFENSEDAYPPDEEFDVLLKDEMGNEWVCSPGPGEQILFQIKAPDYSTFYGFKYTISFIELPMGHDASNVTFQIRVDTEPVSFSKHQPGNMTWKTSLDVVLGVVITDQGGGLVDGDTVSYMITKDKGKSWSTWKNIPGLANDYKLFPQVNEQFNEGFENCVQWKADDTVGNGPRYSPFYYFFIDTEDVVYLDPWPDHDRVSKNESVEFGITISDTMSGINVSSIQYSVSYNAGVTWNDWVGVEIENVSDESQVFVKANHTFRNGTNNLLKWRGWDIAGNGPKESGQFVINVNTWQPITKPQVVLVSPEVGSKINSSEITLEWQQNGPLVSGVVYDLYFDTKSPPTLFIENLLESKYSFKNLVDGMTYYWQVIPRSYGINGTCTSGIWWFEVELDFTNNEIPENYFNITIAGPNNVSLYPEGNTRIELIITNNAESYLLIKLKLEAGEMLRYLMLDDDSIINLTQKQWVIRNLVLDLPSTAKPGIYNIVVSVISEQFGGIELTSHEIIVEVKEKEGSIDNDTVPPDNDAKINDTTEHKGFTMIEIIIITAVLVVIIIILILIVFGILRKRKKTLEDKIQQLGGYTIKPQTEHVQILNVENGAVPSPSGTQPQVDINVPEPTTVQMPKTNQIPVISQLPSSDTSASSETGEPHVESKQVPIAKAAETLRMPEVVQKPKLPPANLNKANVDKVNANVDEIEDNEK